VLRNEEIGLDQWIRTCTAPSYKEGRQTYMNVGAHVLSEAEAVLSSNVRNESPYQLRAITAR
jgi:hypothetical protein